MKNIKILTKIGSDNTIRLKMERYGVYMRKKAVIFDMDGVLIDSEPVYIEKFRSFLEENHCTVDERILCAVAGASSKQTWEYMAQMWYEKIDAEELHQLFRRRHPDFQIPYKEVIYPGIQELLRWLKDKKFILALASSSSENAIKRMMEETGLKGYFSCVVSGNMFRESKPNPDIYLHTLSMLGLPAEDCIAVEDSTYGIQAAKAAGLQVAAVKDVRFSYDQSRADWRVDHTKDLRELLERI